MIISRHCSYPSVHGPAQHARTFANALLKNGYNVTLLSGEFVISYEKSFQDGYTLLKVPIRYVSNSVESSSELYLKNSYDEILASKVFNTFNPDIVHIGIPKQMTAYIDEAFKRNIPTVAIIHSFEWFCMLGHLIDYNNDNCTGPESLEKCLNCVEKSLSKKSYFKYKASEYIIKIFHFFKLNIYSEFYFSKTKKHFLDSYKYLKDFQNKVGGVIIQSNFSLGLIKKFTNSSKKTFLVKQWLTDFKLKKHESPFDKDDSILRIGYIGGLSDYKGVQIIDYALGYMKNVHKVEIWILSPGINKKFMKKYFPNILSKKIAFETFSNLHAEQDYLKVLSSIDLCIIPSVCYEIGPRVLLEAIAQSIPCITSETVGNNYLIEDGYNGKVFQNKNFVMLSDILDNCVDDLDLIKFWSDNLPKIRNEENWFSEIMSVHKKVLSDFS